MKDLIALVDDAAVRVNDRIRFESLRVHSIEHGSAKIEISVTIDGEFQTIAEEGSGAVDGIFKALKPLSGSQPSLKVYQVGAVTGGTDAQAKVTVRLEEDGRIINGQGADYDTLVASARAYINALNKLAVKAQRSAPSGCCGLMFVDASHRHSGGSPRP